MTVRVGTDLIEIERIRRSLARYERFRERCFTEAERAYCDSRPNPAESYAGSRGKRSRSSGGRSRRFGYPAGSRSARRRSELRRSISP
jgi:hypothetical protein